MEGSRGNNLLLRGVIAIILCVIAVFAIVYFTNQERFARTQQTPSNAGITLEEEGTETAYGIRIGNNLKAFLSDEEFFDKPGTIAEPYVEEEGTSLAPRITAEGNVIVVRITDTAGRIITGESFSITVTKTDGSERTTQLTFVDDDMNGVIRTSTLTDGLWEVILRPIAGYLAPATGTNVRLGQYQDDAEEDDDAATDDEADDAAQEASADEENQTEDAGNNGTD